MNIICRTLCGCERIVDIPYRELPSRWLLPFVRTKNCHIFAADGGTSTERPIGFQTRAFERTDTTGLYGYPVYVESASPVTKDAKPPAEKS